MGFTVWQSLRLIEAWCFGESSPWEKGKTCLCQHSDPAVWVTE